MGKTYKPFPLDSWVSKFYKRIGIYEPSDIDISYISKQLRIYLSMTSKRSFSTVQGRFKMIHINQDLEEKKIREVYFHELCHVLRHEGYQYKMMPEAFRELQERDANHFLKYAAIPYHMLKYVDWKSSNLIVDISDTFKISEEIAEYRVQHIYRNAREQLKQEYLG